MQTSGSQPGVRVPPGVREKYQGVRQFRILIENVLKCLIKIHYGVREFSFFVLGGTRSEKGWEPLMQTKKFQTCFFLTRDLRIREGRYHSFKKLIRRMNHRPQIIILHDLDLKRSKISKKNIIQEVNTHQFFCLSDLLTLFRLFVHIHVLLYLYNFKHNGAERVKTNIIPFLTQLFCNT